MAKANRRRRRRRKNPTAPATGLWLSNPKKRRKGGGGRQKARPRVTIGGGLVTFGDKSPFKGRVSRANPRRKQSASKQSRGIGTQFGKLTNVDMHLNALIRGGGGLVTYLGSNSLAQAMGTFYTSYYSQDATYTGKLSKAAVRLVISALMGVIPGRLGDSLQEGAFQDTWTRTILDLANTSAVQGKGDHAQTLQGFFTNLTSTTSPSPSAGFGRVVHRGFTTAPRVAMPVGGRPAIAGAVPAAAPVGAFTRVPQAARVGNSFLGTRGFRGFSGVQRVQGRLLG